VVAAEVRGLADRALGSAREIRDIVQGLDTHLRAVQAAASESVAAAEGGVHAGQQVAQTFQGLQTSSRDTSASVSRMNDVLADQVQAIRRTAALVGDVGELAQAQQQAASAVHAQGEALRAVVQSLDQALGQFELEPAPAAAQASRSRTPA
jgi:methyl-accepting chemotaxis protein